MKETSHYAKWAAPLARLKAGSNIAARVAIIAMTTSNSMSVKADNATPSFRGVFMEENTPEGTVVKNPEHRKGSPNRNESTHRKVQGCSI